MLLARSLQPMHLALEFWGLHCGHPQSPTLNLRLRLRPAQDEAVWAGRGAVGAAMVRKTYRAGLRDDNCYQAGGREDAVWQFPIFPPGPTRPCGSCGTCGNGGTCRGLQACVRLRLATSARRHAIGCPAGRAGRRIGYCANPEAKPRARTAHDDRGCHSLTRWPDLGLRGASMRGPRRSHHGQRHGAALPRPLPRAPRSSSAAITPHH